MVNNFTMPYGAPYGANPYAGYNPYGMSNPYGASPYGMNGSYGGLPNTGMSPYGMNPYAQAGKMIGDGLALIVQTLRNLKDGGGQNSTAGSGNPNKASQAKAADDQWQKCGCSKS